jgi:putative flippase GtrA
MRSRLLAFGLVGAVGFAVDAGVLQLLFSLGGVRPLLGRLVSFPLAVTATWLLNRRFTFKDRAAVPGKSSYFLYVFGQVLGGLLNVATFAAAVWAWPGLEKYPVIPLAFGSGVGLVFNFAWANALVFAQNRHHEASPSAGDGRAL